MNRHLFFHKVDDAVAAVFGKFPAVGIRKPEDISGIFNHTDLHAEANAKVRYIILSRIPAGGDHALDSAVAETARHQNSVDAAEDFTDIFICNFLGVCPHDLNISVIGIDRYES